MTDSVSSIRVQRACFCESHLDACQAQTGLEHAVYNRSSVSKFHELNIERGGSMVRTADCENRESHAGLKLR